MCSVENPNNYSNNEDVVGDNFEKEGAALAVVGASTSGFSQSSLDHTEYGFDLPSLAVLLLVEPKPHQPSMIADRR